MMKPTLLAYVVGLTLLVSDPLFAQNKFSVSIVGAPTISHSDVRFTYLLIDQNGQTTPTTVGINSTSNGYLIGLMGNYAFTPKWSVSTGLWYSRLGMDGTNPFMSTPLPVRIISRDLQIPLLVNYRLTNSRLSPYFSVGALANLHQQTVYRDESNSGLDDVRIQFRSTANIRAILGVGLAYRLNQHLSLTAQPLLIWQFKPNNSYEKFIAYQLNGQVQLMYSF